MSREKWTPESIKALKGRTKIASLTTYDYGMTKLLDSQDIPLLLVGDSMAMVVLGYPDTTQISIDEIEHHLRAAARAKPNGLLAADLSIGTYDTPEDAAKNALRLKAAGAEAVKAEGGREILPQVRAILNEGIPFIGHLGMLPQSVLKEGGYRVKGKTEPEHQKLLDDAKALDEAGAFAVVLELVTPVVAAEITRLISIPTIGIGSGKDCDGQILVTTDLWGTTPDFIPKHVKPNLKIAQEMRTTISNWKANL